MCSSTRSCNLVNSKKNNFFFKSLRFSLWRMWIPFLNRFTPAKSNKNVWQYECNEGEKRTQTPCDYFTVETW